MHAKDNQQMATVLVLENGKTYDVVGSYWSFDIHDSLSDVFYSCHTDGIDYISESCDELREIVHRVECEKAVDEWWANASEKEREYYAANVDDDWDHSIELCGIELPEVNLNKYEVGIEFTEKMALTLLDEYFFGVSA